MDEEQTPEIEKEKELFAFVAELEKKHPHLTPLEFDKEIQQLIALNPDHGSLWFNFCYNEFRIQNADKLPKTRPQILIGGPFHINYPNFHFYPFFKTADIVCLTCNIDPLPFHSAIHCRPTSTFQEILKMLPKGFKPDFYWDNLIEHGHYIPPGIETAPFPIVAGISHTFLHKSVEQVCELFDLILPMSKYSVENLRKKYPNKVIDLPFGVNWGSFHDRITPCWKKNIDICVLFGEKDTPLYEHRNHVLQLMKKFKEKYGDRYRIIIDSELPWKQYQKIMQSSRIAINCTGTHGPYNYRIIDAMCAGAMVMQYQWKNEYCDNDFSELFVDGVHGISFNFEDLENKLLTYLSNPEKIEQIAKQAYAFVTENYDYSKLFQKLTHTVQEREFSFPRKFPDQMGFHHMDMVYYNQNNDKAKDVLYGAIAAFHNPTWIKYNNLMLYSWSSGRYMKEVYFNLLDQLSHSYAELGRHDLWSLCSQFYETALSIAPKEYAWIVRWNFLLLTIEKGNAVKGDIEKMIFLLEKEEVVPFDEIKVMFKYYIDSEGYSRYQLGESGLYSIPEFIILNLNLMKAIDQPKERAVLHQRYALKAAKYCLEQMP